MTSKSGGILDEVREILDAHGSSSSSSVDDAKHSSRCVKGGGVVLVYCLFEEEETKERSRCHSVASLD